MAKILIAFTATSVVAIALTRFACRSNAVRRSLQSGDLHHHPRDDADEREALTENSMSASGQRNGDLTPGDTAAVASGRNSVRTIGTRSTRGVRQSIRSTEKTGGRRHGSEQRSDLRRHRSEDGLLEHSSSRRLPRKEDERVWNGIASDQVFHRMRVMNADGNPYEENSQPAPGQTTKNDSQPGLYPV